MSALPSTHAVIRLSRRPQGEPQLDSFESTTRPTPVPGQGELLYRTLYLSIDPYLRGRMSDEPSYVPPFAIGQPIVSGFVGEVVESRAAGFAAGDKITGLGDWADYGVAKAQHVQRVPGGVPLPSVLGVLGMPGLTAYVGLLDLGRPRPGETVVVSAASGAVGSVVGQLARLKGCRAIGLAGGKAKCEFVTGTLGFDACIDYREENIAESLARHCPTGIDVYFDNVGGDILKAVMGKLADHARILLCGMISEYNVTPPPPGPNLRPLLVHKASIQGFIVSEHRDRVPEFLREMVPWFRDGKIRYREDIVPGLSSAPQALIGLLRGKNFGKLLVQIAP